MVSFLSIVAAPAVSQCVEKRLFRKPTMRLGRLFGMVGPWVYQQGGALGYSLQQEPILLGKLIGIRPELIVETIHDLRDKVATTLTEVINEKKDFFYLYTVRMFRTMGIEITAMPPSKKLEEKVTDEHIYNVMLTAFWEGAALGYHFPDTFREYWGNTYEMRPDAEWEKMRKLGVVMGEQKARPLEEAIVELAEMAMWWVTNESPELLKSHELEIISKLAKPNDDTSTVPI